MAPRHAAAIDALEKAFRQSVPFRGWLRARRWCGDVVGPRTEVSVKDRAVLAEDAGEAVVFFLAVSRDPSGFAQPLHVPLAISAAKGDAEAFEVPVGGAPWYVTDGEGSELYARFVVDGLRDRLTVRTATGDALHFQGEPVGAYRSREPMAEDSSNVLVQIHTTAGNLVFKSYKLLDTSNREAEILERLHKRGFPHAPRYRGELALGKGADRVVLGIARDLVEAGDAFAWLTAGWRGELLGPATADFERASLAFAGRLGEATAALHDALLDTHAGPFQAEPYGEEDAEADVRSALSNLSDSLRRLAALAKGEDAGLATLAAAARARVFESREAIEATLLGLEAGIGTPKGVIHADLHLGQVLRTERDDLTFLDFEGEPDRAPGDRSRKLPPVRDVATMNRSFAYVKHYAWREATRGDATAAWRFLNRDGWSPAEASTANRLAAWEAASVERHTRHYLAKSAVYGAFEPDRVLRAIRGWTMEKALYELRYELKHRPQNIFIPLEGVLSLAGGLPA